MTQQCRRHATLNIQIAGNDDPLLPGGGGPAILRGPAGGYGS